MNCDALLKLTHPDTEYSVSSLSSGREGEEGESKTNCQFQCQELSFIPKK